MDSNEIVNSYATSVSCAGKEMPYDHPLVYLEIDPDKSSINCPYCGKKFILKYQQ